MIRTKLLIITTSLCLSACTFNPFSDQNQLTGNAVGPAIGGTVGAGGAALLGATKPMIAVAGLTGIGIGYYVTTLRFASGGLVQGGGQVFVLGDYVTIDIPTDNLFDTNSDEFLSCSDNTLDSVATILQRYPHNNIIISGNTSGFATERFERRLSESRARQVASYLWAHGVNGFDQEQLRNHRLTFVGYGNYFPIANNIRGESIRQNSHVQITSYPSKDQLLINKKCQQFNNIGTMETISETQAEQQNNFNQEFPTTG